MPAGAELPRHVRLVYFPALLADAPPDARAAGVAELPNAPPPLPDDKVHHATDTALNEGGHIFLEDLNFTTQECPTATAWADKIASWVFPDDEAWQMQFKRRFVVIPDTAFDFLCETGTEVHTRVRIDNETKTVARGALWMEESLPAEAILAGIVQCDRIFDRNGGDITPDGLIDRFAGKSLSLQIGGKATVGRGQMRCVFTRIDGNPSNNGGEQ